MARISKFSEDKSAANLPASVMVEMLEPLFYRRNIRQRLILFLAASGYDVPKLVTMTVGALKDIDLPDEVDEYRDCVIAELADEANAAPAFVYKGGRIFQHNDFYKIIRGATNKVFGSAMSAKTFAQHVLKLVDEYGKTS